MVKRVVQPELLDQLPADDPGAVGSRRDLQRLNRLMRHAQIIAAALEGRLKNPPQIIVELGAGDGSLMLDLAREMKTRWPAPRVLLVDRHPAVSSETLAKLQQLGWGAEAVVADAFDWLAQPAVAVDVVLANLFLHHFDDAQLAKLLALVERRTKFFIACETRRDWPSFAAALSCGLLGCNAVTRNDAKLSMKAGFVGTELSSLWPGNGKWQLTERRAVMFTHLFVADGLTR